MLKGVFFDMDGVVVDSDALWSAVISSVSRKYSLDLSIIDRTGGYNLSTRDAMSLVLEDMGTVDDSLLDHIMEDVEDVYAENLPSLVRLNRGISETLEFLRGKNVYTVLVSNSTSRQVRSILNYFRLDGLFRGIIASDDVSAAKPDPEPYLKALELSGIGCREALVIEDSETGILSAVSAGIPYVRVSSGRASESGILCGDPSVCVNEAVMTDNLREYISSKFFQQFAAL